MSIEELRIIILERYTIDEFVELVDLQLEDLLDMYEGWIDDKRIYEDLGL